MSGMDFALKQPVSSEKKPTGPGHSRHHRLRSAGLVLSILVGPWTVHAPARGDSHRSLDAPAPKGELRYHVGVQQVLVPVTVKERDGRLVDDLRPHEFLLFEDGIEQTIDQTLQEQTPLAMGVVVDLSSSMAAKIEGTRLALSHLLESLDPGDRAFVYGFSNHVHPIQELTRDGESLRMALSALLAKGETALYDAVVEGLYQLHHATEDRRALVVLSDGIDNASLNTARQTIKAAKATGFPVYAVGLGEKNHRGFLANVFRDPMGNSFRALDEIHLRELADRTGGRAIFLDHLENEGKDLSNTVRRAFDRLAQELKGLYVLTFRPARHGLDGQWHRLRVEVLRPHLYLRFRPGYLAIPLR